MKNGSGTSGSLKESKGETTLFEKVSRGLTPRNAANTVVLAEIRHTKSSVCASMQGPHVSQSAEQIAPPMCTQSQKSDDNDSSLP